MKVVIAGGSGLIGQYLASHFEGNGDEVIIISRNNIHANWESDSLVSNIEHSDLLINLAGFSINCRHTTVNKKLILDSRVESTHMLRQAVLQCLNPPKLWVNASACGIYSSATDFPQDENTTLYSEGFLAQVVRLWEGEFFKVPLPQTRQIALRTSVVLTPSGGALYPLSKLAKYGLGGKQGSGRQFFSWIHIEDYFRVVRFLFDTESVSGIVNCTAPTPVSNQELMYLLRRKHHRFFGLPAPTWLIQIGSRLIGTEAALILNSSNVIPGVLIKFGFNFHFSRIEDCIDDLLKYR